MKKSINIENQLIKLSNKQISTQLTGEVIILNHDIGLYFSLNEVGTIIWNELNNSPASIESLVEKVLQVYEIERNTCMADVKSLIQELYEEKLVEYIS